MINLRFAPGERPWPWQTDFQHGQVKATYRLPAKSAVRSSGDCPMNLSCFLHTSSAPWVVAMAVPATATSALFQSAFVRLDGGPQRFVRFQSAGLRSNVGFTSQKGSQYRGVKRSSAFFPCLKAQASQSAASSTPLGPVIVIDNYDSFTYNLCQVCVVCVNFCVWENCELSRARFCVVTFCSLWRRIFVSSFYLFESFVVLREAEFLALSLKSPVEQYLGDLGCNYQVYRNDEISIEELKEYVFRVYLKNLWLYNLDHNARVWQGS